MRRTLAFLLALAAAAPAAVPTPTEHLGYTPGTDYKLADYADITGYFKKLAASSDRIRFVEFGRSAMGRAMYVAFISAPENLKKLDHYRQISSRLALGQPEPDEARRLAREGKAIVWIDSGLHATEVAPVQHSPELAYQLITGETEEIRAIRQNVILMQIPVINPDGLDLVAHWYRKNVGTPYETSPVPFLYQKYAGHDNNRDWYMLNLDETRAVTRLLFAEWFPQIVYNQHQVGPFPARIFVPPYAEPLNPHIPAAVMEGINRIGAAMKERFARENKPGVLSYHGYDAWWNGGLRSVPAFHNMHGILTETALHMYATPRVYEAKEIPERFSNGLPAREPTIFYQRPWLGGKWSIRDAIDYMLTADFAILDLAASRPSEWLYKSYEMARASIDAGKAGKPYAYVIAPGQWDRPASLDMLERLAAAGVEVKRARRQFQAGKQTYPEGSYVMPAAQPFRGYLLDLMEPQKYPEIRTGASGPTKRPYDITGWTLPMLMGVAVDRIEDAFSADLAHAGEFTAEGIVKGSGRIFTLDHRETAVFQAIPFFLGRQEKVRFTAGEAIVVDSAYVENPGRAANFARQYGVTVNLRDSVDAKALYELRPPKLAVYESWQPNIDQGWTQFVLDRYQVPYTLLHNDDFRKGPLGPRFDTLILASQGTQSLLHGFRNGEYSQERAGEGGPRSIVVQRPEYTGGIGAAGVAELERFVSGGGTLIALDGATDLPVQFFPLPVRNVVRPGDSGGFYSPGSLLRMTANPANPLALGMPKEFIGFTTGGFAFDVDLAPGYDEGGQLVRSAARFAEKDLLASGWASGERAVAGRHALLEARHGKGRVILFGFRPQFRGQTLATFKLLLNAVYLGSAQPL